MCFSLALCWFVCLAPVFPVCHTYPVLSYTCVHQCSFLCMSFFFFFFFSILFLFCCLSFGCLAFSTALPLVYDHFSACLCCLPFGFCVFMLGLSTLSKLAFAFNLTVSVSALGSSSCADCDRGLGCICFFMFGESNTLFFYNLHLGQFVKDIECHSLNVPIIVFFLFINQKHAYTQIMTLPIILSSKKHNSFHNSDIA